MSSIALAFIVTLLPQAKDPDVATISLDLKDTPLGKVLEIVTKETGIPIELHEDVKKELDLEKELISVQLTKIQVTGALKLLLGPRACDVKVVDKKKILIVRSKD